MSHEGADQEFVDFLKFCFNNDAGCVEYYKKELNEIGIRRVGEIVNETMLAGLMPLYILAFGKSKFFRSIAEKVEFAEGIRKGIEEKKAVASRPMQSPPAEPMDTAEVVKSKPWLENVEKFVYYSKVDTREGKTTKMRVKECPNVRNCGVQLDKRRILTFRHIQHSKLKIGDVVNVYNAVAESNTPIAATVQMVEDDKDFVILESNQDLPGEDLPNLQYMPERGDKYLLLGYPDETEPPSKPSVLVGMIETVSVDKKGHILGTGSARPGFSGGPIFVRPNYLIGICIRGGPDASRTYLSDLSNRLTYGNYVVVLPLAIVTQSLLRA